MTINDLKNYLEETPENTNINIVIQIVEDIANTKSKEYFDEKIALSTVTPEKILRDEKAYNAQGELIVGTLETLENSGTE